MLEMVYQSERKEEILYKGEYKGFEYKIVSYGTHPCCYVVIPKNHKFYNKDYDDICVMCHGGMTYAGKEKDNKFWIGWDYAHYGDYTGVCEMPILKEFKYLHKNDKKWTTKELIKETKEVIEQL